MSSGNALVRSLAKRWGGKKMGSGGFIFLPPIFLPKSDGKKMRGKNIQFIYRVRVVNVTSFKLMLTQAMAWRST